MKKLLSVIFCAIMLIAMASPAFANEPINDNATYNTFVRWDNAIW